MLHKSSAESRSFLRHFHSAIRNHLSIAISMSPEWMVAGCISRENGFLSQFYDFRCTSVASQTVSVMPWNPTPFVRDTAKTNVNPNGRWVIRTGPFRALKFEGSDTMNFKTNFGFCFGTVDNNGRCAQVRNEQSSRHYENTPM